MSTIMEMIRAKQMAQEQAKKDFIITEAEKRKLVDEAMPAIYKEQRPFVPPQSVPSVSQPVPQPKLTVDLSSLLKIRSGAAPTQSQASPMAQQIPDVDILDIKLADDAKFANPLLADIHPTNEVAIFDKHITYLRNIIDAGGNNGKNEFKAVLDTILNMLKSKPHLKGSLNDDNYRCMVIALQRIRDNALASQSSKQIPKSKVNDGLMSELANGLASLF